MCALDLSKYPLEKVAEATAILLPSNEYLVDNYDITSPDSYLRLSVSASWDAKYNGAVIKVIFEATAAQSVNLKSHLEDEGTADDIDSGIGDTFNAAFSEVYPDAESPEICRTSTKVKIVKN
jgi:hypothetical protein